MKKVFNTASELIHVYAQQSQESGRCHNVFFENTTDLYSYGHHYLLAKFIKTKESGKTIRPQKN